MPRRSSSKRSGRPRAKATPVRRRLKRRTSPRRPTPRAKHGGALIVVSAPSGAGKTTIAHELMRRIPSLQFSVSATTRQARPGEVDGVDYFYLTKEEFRRRVRAGEFVEWEEIYGDYYGTLQSEIDRALKAGRHLVFDIDVNGALSIKRKYPDALLLFIRPPSLEVLTERLRNRHTEDEARLAKRLARVPMEMEKGAAFDAQIVNDDVQRATAEAQQRVENHLQQALRSRRSRHGHQTNRS